MELQLAPIYKICNLYFHIEDIVQGTKAQLTLIRTVEKETRQNTVDLLNLSLVLRQITYDVVNANRTFVTAIDKLTKAVLSMRELEFTALILQQKLIKFQEGIVVTSSGRHSSVLVPPTNLSILLELRRLSYYEYRC